MKIASYIRIGIVLLLGTGMVGFMIACSDSGSSTGSSPAAAKPVEKKAVSVETQWIELKPMDIKIPEGIEGEAQLTRNIYFIMDGSGSMNEPTSRNCGGDQRFPSKMAGARWAIKKFLENVPDDVNIGLYLFDLNGRRQVIPLGTSNREAFITAVDAIEAGGQTPLAQALRYGTDRLVEQYRKQLGYGEFRLVAVTDGIADDIPAAALYAAQYGMPIYAIGLCIQADHPLRHFAVSYRAADNFEDLQKGLEDTLAELPSFDVTEFQQ
jgi:Ca-activated chloride channel homolog